METNLGKITDAKNISSDKRARVQGGIYITFLTNENINKNQYVKVVVNGKSYPFMVSDVVIEGKDLLVSAREVGYWAQKLDREENFDLRTLIDLDVELVTDSKKIEDIITQSCWC